MLTPLLLYILSVCTVSGVFVQRGIKEIRNMNVDSEINAIDLSGHIQVKDAFTTARNTIKYKSQQHYRGVPIFGAHLVMEQDQPVFGKYYDPKQIALYIESVTPVINESDAIQTAMNELRIKSKDDIYGKTDVNLYIYFYLNKPYLSYIIRFTYTKNNQMHQPMIILEANEGRILAVYDEAIQTVVESCGDGGNRGTGKYQYCVDKPSLFIDTYPYVANENVVVYDNLFYAYSDKSHAERVECVYPESGPQTKCYIQDEGLNGGYCAACDVYAFTSVVFDLYDEWLNGSKPVSADQIPLKAYVHVGNMWVNANYDWLNGAMNFGDGAEWWYPLNSLDVTAHEMAHGFTEQGSSAIYTFQSGAMNEAYSDLVGEVAKYFYHGSNDWMIGRDIFKTPNTALRYMFDPPFDGHSIGHAKDYVVGMDVHLSSGVYNKVFWILNQLYNWTMIEEFKVFSYANNYYWPADTTFNEGVCGAIMALHDLYGADLEKVNSMQNGLELAFLSVGLECLIVNNTGLPSQGVSCGVNTYCFYQDIIALQYEETEFVLRIENQHDYATTVNNIYYTVAGLYDCIDASLTFEYETIDYGFFDEYNDPTIQILDENNAQIALCVNDQSNNSNYTKECGSFETCIFEQRFKNKISVGETYKLQIIGGFSHYMNNYCGDGIVMNAIVKLKCNTGTSAPTKSPSYEPTDQPTNSSLSPTASPVTAPTISTNNPTPYPTYSINEKKLCNANFLNSSDFLNLNEDQGVVAYCYDIDVYPNDNTTATTVSVKNIDSLNGSDYINWKLFFISFTINDYDCVSPLISFEYEPIDNDIFGLLITNNNLDLYNTLQCDTNERECGAFQPCLGRAPLLSLGIAKIDRFATYNISIFEPPFIAPRCNHQYSINAKLTLYCNGGSASPTTEPTAVPTDEPTYQTPQPTDYPSLEPTQPTGTPTMRPTPNISTPFALSGQIHCFMNQSDSVNGEIMAENAMDYFYFELLENNHFGYTVLFSSCNSSYDTLLYLYDINGRVIKRADDEGVCGVNAELEMAWIDAGDYILGVSGCCNELHHDFGKYLLNVLCYDYHQMVGNQTQNNNKSDGGVPCGVNRYCYEINMNVTSQNETQFIQNIYHNTNMIVTTFDIYIQSIGEYDCVNPAFTFEFERIDHNQHNKYIDIYDNNNVLLSRCGGGGQIQTECDIFEACLNDYYLDWNSIQSDGGSYKISVINSNAIKPKCDTNNNYTINAIVTIGCNSYETTTKPSSTLQTTTTTTTTSVSQTTYTSQEVIYESQTEAVDSGWMHTFGFITFFVILSQIIN